jgi:hypothetical protein
LYLPPFVEDNEDEDEDDSDIEQENEHDESATGQEKIRRDHDPEDSGKLPASVLIGLALLPFMIPIVWLITPLVIGQAPNITVAAPLALAVAASVLCLAVISTIDWTPATQVKGVLLLVALSYLTAVGLYVLKKDLLDRVRRLFGVDPPWTEFVPADAGYAVKVPSQQLLASPDQPLSSPTLACRKATLRAMTGMTTYTVGSSDPPMPLVRPRIPALGSDDWFDWAVDDLVTRAKGELDGRVEVIRHDEKFPGRQLAIKLKDSGMIRIARLYVINGRVYYLAVDAPHLDAEDDLVTQFFDSFRPR